MKPSSTETKNPAILLNFRIPTTLKLEFQDICRNQHISMTARLNLMVHQFVVETALKPNKSKRSPETSGDDWREQLHG